MKSYALRSDLVSLDVTEIGGQLSDVTFTLPGGRRVSPMHKAPWTPEELAPDTPPVIQMLRGDFFCAPFGAADITPGTPSHGHPASGTWRQTAATATTLDTVLDETVLGATITKHVELRDGETIVYQRHEMIGGNGRTPLGHHAMLNAGGPLNLSFSPYTTALTPPVPFELMPEGRPLLPEGLTIDDLTRAPRAGGGHVDLTVFPTAPDTEALFMLVSDKRAPFGWIGATCPAENWVWFALRDVAALPQTVVWMSDGGRDYAPWNGRHRGVIGLEDVRAYFHLGEKASLADNPVSAGGSPTTVTLTPGGKVTISYIFGLAAVPEGFDRVEDIVTAPGGVMLIGAGGREVLAPCDLDYIKGAG